MWENQTWMLHHDNTPAQALLLIRSYLAKHQSSIVPNPPYSPDLAPAAFSLFPKLTTTFHTHTHCSSSSFTVTLSLIRRTACAHAQFTRCSSTINARSEMGQKAVCCQNLTLDALSSRSTLSVLVGALFKMFVLFLNTSCM